MFLYCKGETMLTMQNVLDENSISHLIKLADFEIENFLCYTVPKYQSWNNMHIKYKDDPAFIKLIDIIQKTLKNEIKFDLKVNSCWFNICKEDSKFEFHKHERTVASVVLFLKNCEDNGTLFKFDNSVLRLIIKDNDLVVFNPDRLHSIPEWKGKDRYSLAFDFV